MHVLTSHEDDLICDLAEIYNIYDYEQLPLYRVAVFVSGLPDTSRVMRALTGQKITFERLMLTSVVDRLNVILWAKTQDGQKNRNRPKSLVESLVGKASQTETKSFSSGEAFERSRAQLLSGGEESGN